MTQRFEEIRRVDKSQVERAFENGSKEEIVYSLLGIALHDRDWEWVEKWCLHFLESSIPDIRNTAIIGLGHLARIHGTLHKVEVLDALSKYVSDQACSGRIEDAIDDIELFVK